MSKAKRERVKRTKKSRGSGKTLDIAVLIDKIFAERVVVKEGGLTRRITCIRAMIHQLWQKSIGGSRKAHKLYIRYLRFVATQVPKGGFEIRFGPDLLTAEEVHRKHGRKL